MCERMHQSDGNVSQTLLYANPRQSLNEANELIDPALATASHAIRANIHPGLGSLPGDLAFGRDMFLVRPDYSVITMGIQDLGVRFECNYRCTMVPRPLPLGNLHHPHFYHSCNGSTMLDLITLLLFL